MRNWKNVSSMQQNWEQININCKQLISLCYLVEWLSVRNKMIIKRTINGESQSKKLITWRWLLQIREKGRTQNGEGGNKVNASENSTHLNAGYGSSQLQTSVKPDFVQDPEIEFQTGFFFPLLPVNSVCVRFPCGFRAGPTRVWGGFYAGSTRTPRAIRAVLQPRYPRAFLLPQSRQVTHASNAATRNNYIFFNSLFLLLLLYFNYFPLELLIYIFHFISLFFFEKWYKKKKLHLIDFVMSLFIHQVSTTSWFLPTRFCCPWMLKFVWKHLMKRWIFE